MTCRPSTIAALLVVSAVLAGQAAAAPPITTGDRGSADGLLAGPVVVPDGQSLPSPASPGGHGLPMRAPDKASVYKAYATVAHTPDGKTTVTPASPTLRAVIDEEYGTDLIL